MSAPPLPGSLAPAPLRLGHRGQRLPGGPRENTMAAFEQAWATGCDGFELDVRTSADRRLLLHHDARLSRAGLRLAAHPWAQLRRARPDLTPLDAVLRQWGARAFLDIEVKVPGVERELAALLRRHPPRAGFVVSCFQLRVLRRLRTLAPDLPLCLNLRRPWSLERLQAAGVDWVAPEQSLCPAWYVRRLKSAGWRVLVWTVNRPAKMRRMAAAGADAVVSDDPALLLRTLRRAP